MAGAQVVFFDSRKKRKLLSPNVYSKSLKKLIIKVSNSIESKKPIVIQSYCASSGPALKAVSEIQSNLSNTLHIVIDRGFEINQKFFESLTIMTRLPCVKKIIKNNYTTNYDIQKIKGNVAFILPQKEDQILGYSKNNKTKKLIKLFKDKQKEYDTHYLTEHATHWSKWDKNTMKKIGYIYKKWGVLKKDIVIDENAYPTPKKIPLIKKFFIYPLIRITGV